MMVPRLSRSLQAALWGGVLLVTTAFPLRAQESVLLGLAGAAGGLAVGTYTTTAVYVAKARTGRYLFSVDEFLQLRLETLPIPLGAIGGAIVGAHSGHTLGETAIWGGVGFVGGAALGSFVGERVWETNEGRWAGAIIGAAVGMLTGAALGAHGSWNRGEEPGAPSAALDAGISIPISLGGGP